MGSIGVVTDRNLCPGGSFNAAPFRYQIDGERLEVNITARLQRDRDDQLRDYLLINHATEPLPEPGIVFGYILVVGNMIKIIADSYSESDLAKKNTFVAGGGHDSPSSNLLAPADRPLTLDDPGQEVALVFNKVMTLTKSSSRKDDWQVC